MAATPAYVATLGATAATGGTTIAVTLTANQSVDGAPLVLYLAWASTTATLSSVVDARSNTWVLEPTGTGTAVRGAVATCLVPTTRLLVGDTVTVTLSASVTKTAVLAEFFGLKQSGTPRDGTIQAGSGAGTSGTSQAVASGNLTTANATDLLLGLVADNQNVNDTLAASGWTALARAGGTGLSLWGAYRAVAATGSYDLNGSLSGGGTATRAWLALEYAFKASDISAPQTAFVGTEVAYVVDTGRSLGFLGAEVAHGTTHAAVAFLGAEVAHVPVPSARRRPGPWVLVALPAAAVVGDGTVGALLGHTVGSLAGTTVGDLTTIAPP